MTFNGTISHTVRADSLATGHLIDGTAILAWMGNQGMPVSNRQRVNTARRLWRIRSVFASGAQVTLATDQGSYTVPAGRPVKLHHATARAAA